MITRKNDGSKYENTFGKLNVIDNKQPRGHNMQNGLCQGRSLSVIISKQRGLLKFVSIFSC